MTPGLIDNSPPNFQFVQTYNSTASIPALQQRLIQTLYEINKEEFTFEQAGNPTIPGCRIIFEFGLADAGGFNYIDEEEVKKAQSVLEKEHLDVLDFFCAVRYYKGEGEEKRPLKFDYYLVRTVYNRSLFEIQVCHKKGLKYVSSEDLTSFIFNKVNEASKRKLLKQHENLE